MNLDILTEFLEWLEERTKPLFVGVALLLYAISLVQLAGEINPAQELEEFLVQALINLSIPFGVILLQEMFELLTSISRSSLISARRQFEIVVLVIVRSFFKSFSKVNEKVADGIFGDPIQEAIVKVFAIMIMVGLILYFRHIAQRRILEGYAERTRRYNIWKQVVVLILAVIVLVDMIFVLGGFEELEFISLMFTGLIVIDAIFLLIAILGDSRFNEIAFESALVISLIFARFPLFTSNTLSYILSVLGVLFATVSLYLLFKSYQLGSPMAHEEHHLEPDEAE